MVLVQNSMGWPLAATLGRKEMPEKRRRKESYCCGRPRLRYRHRRWMLAYPHRGSGVGGGGGGGVVSRGG